MGLRVILRRLGIYCNAYYNYKKQRKAKYYQHKAELKEIITEEYHKYKGIPGYRQMRKLLSNKGISLSATTCHKLMNKELKLFSVTRRHKPGYCKCEPHKVFENKLNRDFTAKKRNQKWCTDFTYIQLKNGSMRYNCAIIDLCDRSVAASVYGRSITSELAIKAVEKAIKLNPRVKLDGVMLHSDQGSQFTSKSFTEYCKSNTITQSMSRAG